MTFDLTLTFDNGPDPDVTPYVLSILADFDIKSTFFVVGEKARRYPELCRMIVDQGHWLGNHTWSHTLPLGLMRDPRQETFEVLETHREISSLLGNRRLFRPMGGGGEIGPHLLSTASLQALRENRYSCVLWNSVPGDWRDHHGWPVQAAADLARNRWTVMVLHDTSLEAMTHLPQFIGDALSLGTRFRQDFPEGCLPIKDGIMAVPVSEICVAH
jgi:peptidoglycan/xylan/chitin deacetylase (PgdA/CDA1 family)